MYAGHFDFAHPLVWEVPELMSAAECASVVERYREGPWLEATVNSAEGRVVASEIRDNTVALVRDEALARDLVERLRRQVPETMIVEHPKRGRVRWAYEGLFVPMRIYRYAPGQHFGLHQDQSYVKDDLCRSLLTFMVYLNEDFEGGATSFPDRSLEIVPVTGKALLFQHAILHGGGRVTRGTKLVLRSDVLYRALDVTPA
jgi:predicted 2-oxoglutarate/Fe(II)-dependent dioxygenase YbiX